MNQFVSATVTEDSGNLAALASGNARRLGAGVGTKAMPKDAPIRSCERHRIAALEFTLYRCDTRG